MKLAGGMPRSHQHGCSTWANVVEEWANSSKLRMPIPDIRASAASEVEDMRELTQEQKKKVLNGEIREDKF